MKQADIEEAIKELEDYDNDNFDDTSVGLYVDEGMKFAVPIAVKCMQKVKGIVHCQGCTYWVLSKDMTRAFCDLYSTLDKPVQVQEGDFCSKGLWRDERSNSDQRSATYQQLKEIGHNYESATHNASEASGQQVTSKLDASKQQVKSDFEMSCEEFAKRLAEVAVRSAYETQTGSLSNLNCEAKSEEVTP